MNALKKNLMFLLSTSLCLNVFAKPVNGYWPSKNGFKPILFEKKEGLAFVEGDILLGDAKKIATLPTPSAIIVSNNSHYWPKGVVPYKLSSSLSVSSQKAILSAMIIWLNQTPLKFIAIDESNEKEYPDYIQFVPVDGTECSSHVGKQGGEQVIRLAPRCQTYNIVHEIGHALGLWHEQSRHDRDKYIHIHWEDIDEDSQYNFNQHLSDGEDIGEYDYDSIMHYGPYAFSKNGKETISVISAGKSIGQRNHLSLKDIKAIQQLYGSE